MGRKFDSQTKEISSVLENRANKTSTIDTGATNNCINIPDDFKSSTNKQSDKKACTLLILKTHGFSDCFTGINCFEGPLKLQVSEGSHPCQSLHIRVAYILHYKKSCIAYKTYKWCYSFVLVPKANSKVRLSLDLTQLNKILIWSIYRGLILNDILPKLCYVRQCSLYAYLILISLYAMCLGVCTIILYMH